MSFKDVLRNLFGGKEVQTEVAAEPQVQVKTAPAREVEVGFNPDQYTVQVNGRSYNNKSTRTRVARSPYNRAHRIRLNEQRQK